MTDVESLSKLIYDAITEDWQTFELDVQVGIYDRQCRRIARRLIERGARIEARN